MKNLNKMSIDEIKEVVSEFFEDETTNEILKLPISEIINILEEESICTATGDLLHSQKRTPSRKKQANRLKKSSTTTYKKNKNKKWIEQRRTNISEEDTNNRSYLNKVSKGYTKLQPHVKPKAKK